MKRFKIALVALLMLFGAGALWAAEIEDLNVTDASNTGRFPENMAPSAVNDGARALEGIIARWHRDWNASVVDYGAANTIMITPNRTIGSLYDGLMFGVKVTAANTGATTVQVSTASAKALVGTDLSALSSGDLSAGEKIIIVYNADNDNFQVIGGGASGSVSGGDGISVSGSTVSVNITSGFGLEISASKLAIDIGDATAVDITGDDVLLFHDTSSDLARKVTPGNVLGALRHQTVATPVSGDYIVFTDDSDGDRVKTAQINDLPGSLSLETEIATTSGTTHDFTGIPSGTKRITLMWIAGSVSGNDDYLVQIGDSGGIETSGYDSWSFSTNGTTTAVQTSTAGCIFDGQGAADDVHATIVLTLEDSANNTWTCSTDYQIGSSYGGNGAGSKSLSAELTQIRLTTVGGATFDAGGVNIIHE